MVQLLHFIFLISVLGSLHHTVNGIAMEKLANKKLCADEDCAYAISLAKAEDDYIAVDCRFINIRRGQLIYVYSKLVPEEGAGEFWFGNVYNDRFVDQMGVLGYFPSNLVKETHVFHKGKTEIMTTVSSVLVVDNIIC
ncbi:OTOR protein, partial [Polyodon spathula]|nr:OTOR protein [Polyodon spathula]